MLDRVLKLRGHDNARWDTISVGLVRSPDGLTLRDWLATEGYYGSSAWSEIAADERRKGHESDLRFRNKESEHGVCDDCFCVTSKGARRCKECSQRRRREREEKKFVGLRRMKLYGIV